MPAFITLRVLLPADVASCEPLVAEGEAAGFRFLRRWIETPGPIPAQSARTFFLGAFDRTRLVGVGGITPDPYVDDVEVGRLRHVCVAQSHRRAGVGSQLVQALEEGARSAYTLLRLRTDTSGASAFYEALGYASVAHVTATHVRQLRTAAPSPSDGW